MTIQELIHTNNELRAQLKPDNRKKYEELLTLMRIKGYNRDDQQLEESLMELLTDLTEAEKNGQDFETYFGQDTKELANSLLAQLPKASPKSRLTLLLLCLLSFVAAYGISHLFFIGNADTLGHALRSFVFQVLGYGGLTYALFFSKLPKEKRWFMATIAVLISLLANHLVRIFLS